MISFSLSPQNFQNSREVKYMAETKMYGCETTVLLCSRATTRRVASFASRVSFETPKPTRLGVLAMAVKRSPKRLKYSAPNFTKEGGLVYVEADPSGEDSWKLEPVVELLKKGAVGVIPTDTVYGPPHVILFIAFEAMLSPEIIKIYDMNSSPLVSPTRNYNVLTLAWYAIVCHLKSHSAIERLRRIKNIEPSKARNLLLISFLFNPLSILCHSLRDIDIYTTGFPRGDGQGHANIFRAVKHCLPGPYTFILTASKELPKKCVRYGTTTAKYASRKDVGVRIPDDAICQAILEKMDAPLISTSVKWPKENEWMIDPVVIADIYGPEGLDFVVDVGVRVADPSTVVDMTGIYPKIIRQGKGPKLHWMEEENDPNALEDLIPSAT
ncbi:hypothetical protein JRO89_XS01G0218600 [Xanthoceras sorbifolium]|uniref:Threonylcarbamoyl-AMP synthase n=1 Tax=Xanthoceras sorbifolium TaxID=99658 RepID=A0ABQ8IKG8_9ROSI|nr:hypothetical protein JRO89_XS01G0218600 [Xanthoceras sorbifolium]